jgi:single-stranded-DNA-specific exonuclease
VIQHPQYQLKRWVIAPPADPQVLAGLKRDSLLEAQLLYNRGIVDTAAAAEFLAAGYPTDTDPFLMKDMELAVERISRALTDNQPIAIYGDYDVDGVTSTALLVEVLRNLGGEVQAYIPDRFEEGYGLNKNALQALHERGVQLVITVDCGVRSAIEAEYCREIGLDLIISDHHHPENVIPPALAVINPKIPGQTYPYPDLAGVGVAYKIAQAVLEKMGGGKQYADRWLDLVALGTVADLAPLTGENRALVRAGLQAIRTGRRTGLIALCRTAGVNQSAIGASDIGFMLGPRLNAAGRLETAMNAYQLLVTTDPIEAGDLASLLNRQNTDRQEITRQTQAAAVERIGTLGEDDYLLFVTDPDFNEGIVGLAASRLAEQFYRPAVVGVTGPETTRCSCRSIPGFHITNALDECSELFIRHGGHAAAAGFTVPNQRVEELRTRLREIARRELAEADLTPQMSADAQVNLADLNPQLLAFLDRLQPTGYGNPETFFVARNLTVKTRRAIGSDNRHLKLAVTDGWFTIDAICFRFGHLVTTLPPKVDLLFSFERNFYNGQVYLQLNVKDIQASE